MLYFKHLYGTQVPEWGVVGFHRPSALNGYRRGDRVLLAVTRSPGVTIQHEPEVHGKIFGVCTLFSIPGQVGELANPEMVRAHPDVAEEWPFVVPVDRFWRFAEPRDYRDFPELNRRAGAPHGAMIPVEEPEVERWLAAAERREVHGVYRSDRARRVGSLLPR